MASYILREELVQALKNNPDSVAVVDVRGDDHVGGHIKGSTNVPSHTLDWRMPELVRTLKDKEVVVFHCAYSQVRGPKAFREYRELRRAARDKAGEPEADPQRACVLQGGFHSWQAKFGHDKDLTEAYAADIWEWA